jgi:hypothetical protein
MTTIVKFPGSASRRIAARRPRRSKNGAPEERAAKAAAQSTHATIAALPFDPAAWLKRCAVAAVEVTYTMSGGLFFGVDDTDLDKMLALLLELKLAPGARDAVKALLRDGSRSAGVL